MQSTVVNDELINVEDVATKALRPWEQQAGESHRHYEWFHEFLLLGPSRTLLGAFKKHQAQRSTKRYTQPSGAWRDACVKGHWHERAQAYDKEQRRIEEDKLQERRNKLLSRRLDIAEKIYDKLELMASFPVATTRQVGNTTIIEPAKWSFDTILKMVQAGERLLADEDQTTVKVTHRKSTVASDELLDDDDELTEEEIEERIFVIFERARERRDSSLAKSAGIL